MDDLLIIDLCEYVSYGLAIILASLITYWKQHILRRMLSKGKEVLLAYGEDVTRLRDLLEWGEIDASCVCPQCRTRGIVRTKRVKRRTGITTRDTGAVLMARLALLLPYSAGRGSLTRCHCGKCKSTWIS